jgi:hypothetical protein
LAFLFLVAGRPFPAAGNAAVGSKVAYFPLPGE